ncbi:hypothetical protein [Sphingobacterium sp. HMA12]|uniref:hypothetical protein n=1 Tax=Sphingobacterium sp. HMA12 TaxID=2050894 RepID=UPI00352A4B79
MLEERRIIKRKIFATIPLAVEYSLTRTRKYLTYLKVKSSIYECHCRASIKSYRSFRNFIIFI